MDKKLERILSRVQKPARYTGGEYNAVKKDPREVDTRVAFCFPDTYEIGMSNIGMRILYGVMNNMEGVWCERVFAPWGDMEEEMRWAHIPLFALESGDPITDFEFVAFSVGYEMAYTTILNMLDLADLPLHSADRHGPYAPGDCRRHGYCTTLSPLPTLWISSVSGEGEELTRGAPRAVPQGAAEGGTRRSFLRREAENAGAICALRCTTSRTTGRYCQEHNSDERRAGNGDKTHSEGHRYRLLPDAQALCPPRRSSTTE